MAGTLTIVYCPDCKSVQTVQRDILRLLWMCRECGHWITDEDVYRSFPKESHN
jgi:ribosomal protein L37AE/L43A